MTDTSKPSTLDPAVVTPRIGSRYPAPFDQPCAARERRALGDPLDLTQFGVNLLSLPPGAWSSQRHWHQNEDEFVYVLDGEVTLVTDAGEQQLGPGMAAGFPAGQRNGHHFINRSDRLAWMLEVGTRAPRDLGEYPDIDLKFESQGSRVRFLRKNGDPY